MFKIISKAALLSLVSFSDAAAPMDLPPIQEAHHKPVDTNNETTSTNATQKDNGNGAADFEPWTEEELVEMKKSKTGENVKERMARIQLIDEEQRARVAAAKSGLAKVGAPKVGASANDVSVTRETKKPTSPKPVEVTTTAATSPKPVEEIPSNPTPNGTPATPNATSGSNSNTNGAGDASVGGFSDQVKEQATLLGIPEAVVEEGLKALQLKAQRLEEERLNAAELQANSTPEQIAEQEKELKRIEAEKAKKEAEQKKAQPPTPANTDTNEKIPTASETGSGSNNLKAKPQPNNLNTDNSNNAGKKKDTKPATGGDGNKETETDSTKGKNGFSIFNRSQAILVITLMMIVCL